MLGEKKVAVTTTLLIIALSSMPHAGAFGKNQQAAIVIGSSFLTYPAGGLAFDQSGNLWVADLQNSRVLGFMSPFSGNMNASVVLGQPDLQHAYGSGWLANRMTYPSSVAFDHGGNLWVADSDNNRVTEFVPPIRNGMNASLVIGQRLIPPSVPSPDWSTTVPATSRNGLSSPDGIAFDAHGDLWVADSWNGRVLEFQPPFSNNMNASIVIGERDFISSCNDESHPLCGDSRTLNNPKAVGFDSMGNLWVADTINLGTYANPRNQGRLLEFTPPLIDGMTAALVAKIPGASSMAFDSIGNLWLGCGGCTSNASGYVSEYTPAFSNSMTPSLIIGGNNTGNHSQTVTSPTGLAFDSTGNLWVVDSNRVLGFGSRVHSVLGSTGRVYFENNIGLLVPLSSIPTPSIGFMLFPDGMFKFTIQGLPAGGSVKLAISFPSILPSGVGWANAMNSNPLAWGIQELQMLPASQVQVNGNNMTLTLTGASEEGVISVVGGPALSSITTASATSFCCTTNSTVPTPSAFLTELIPVSVAILMVIGVGFALYRRRSRKSPK